MEVFAWCIFVLVIIALVMLSLKLNAELKRGENMSQDLNTARQNVQFYQGEVSRIRNELEALRIDHKSLMESSKCNDALRDTHKARHVELLRRMSEIVKIASGEMAKSGGQYS